MDDDVRSGLPSTSKIDENENGLLNADRRMSVRLLADTLN